MHYSPDDLQLDLQTQARLLNSDSCIQYARGLSVTGTLAIVVTAARRGLVDLSTTLTQLQQIGFRASPELIQAILDQERKGR